jgi:putative addiction module component (TIGR02574 family)
VGELKLKELALQTDNSLFFVFEITTGKSIFFINGDKQKMSMTLTQLEAEVFKLPVDERAVLADHIISNLDSDHEVKWLDEADRRYAEYLAGKMKSRPSEDVLRDAFSRLKASK